MHSSCCCVIAALICLSAAAVNVERTVEQVQNILQANSQLPRLTREEILELLNDIRAEDAKLKSTESYEYLKTTTPYNTEENEVNYTQQEDDEENVVASDKETTSTPKPMEKTTKSEPSVMVVLPYTPRDGASLQELYTRPPRVEVVPASMITPIPTVKPKALTQEALSSNTQSKYKPAVDFPAELQAFLEAHGLKGKPGQDNFLLPLEGFKPLPAAKVVDGEVQLPENLLLTYDLISDFKESEKTDNQPSFGNGNFLYEPLKPQTFELDTAASEEKKIQYPYDMPKTRKTKSATTPKPNDEPLDYDSIKVIPLNKGPNPVEDENTALENELNKRQTNNTDGVTTTEAAADVTTTVLIDSKDAMTNAPTGSDLSSSAASGPAADAGASLSDLEDSFGGAAPDKPGDSELPPPRKNGFYWMLDWNSFLEVGDEEKKVNIRFEPKLGDPQMFLPVTVP